MPAFEPCGLPIKEREGGEQRSPHSPMLRSYRRGGKCGAHPEGLPSSGTALFKQVICAPVRVLHGARQPSYPGTCFCTSGRCCRCRTNCAGTGCTRPAIRHELRAYGAGPLAWTSRSFGPGRCAGKAACFNVRRHAGMHRWVGGLWRKNIVQMGLWRFSIKR